MYEYHYLIPGAKIKLFIIYTRINNINILLVICSKRKCCCCHHSLLCLVSSSVFNQYEHSIHPSIHYVQILTICLWFHTLPLHFTHFLLARYSANTLHFHPSHLLGSLAVALTPKRASSRNKNDFDETEWTKKKHVLLFIFLAKRQELNSNKRKKQNRTEQLNNRRQVVQDIQLSCLY